jgi:hypothetical protein
MVVLVVVVAIAEFALQAPRKKKYLMKDLL